MRRLGELWPVSSLTIGGGGLGQLWGTTSRDQAVATMREAIDAGINLLDVAPRYGDAEAERVVGDAFGGQLPESVGVGAFPGRERERAILPIAPGAQWQPVLLSRARDADEHAAAGRVRAARADADRCLMSSRGR